MNSENSWDAWTAAGLDHFATASCRSPPQMISEQIKCSLSYLEKQHSPFLNTFCACALAYGKFYKGPRGLYFSCHYLAITIFFACSPLQTPCHSLISGILVLQNIDPGMAAVCVKECAESVRKLWFTCNCYVWTGAQNWNLLHPCSWRCTCHLLYLTDTKERSCK